MSILQHSTEEGSSDTVPLPPPRLVPYERKKICAVCNVMVSVLGLKYVHSDYC